MSFEESLVQNASPTLASIKVANLYSYRFKSEEECNDNLNYFNSILNPKGIYIELVKKNADLYLIYVYRKSQLQLRLKDKQIGLFLEQYGYSEADEPQSYISALKKRLIDEKDFPHEIGVFLGYPLEDVKAFIATKGRGCVMCGEWKVYHNEQSARYTFCKYKHCKEVYVKIYGEGRKLSDMLVGA